MRKLRSDAELGKLPLHIRQQLITWLLVENIGYEDAVERLHLDYNIDTHTKALAGFWQRYVAPRVLRHSADAADGFVSEAGGLAADWSEPSKAMVRQKFFELVAARHTSPKELALFAEMISAIERGELERNKLRTRRQEISIRTRLKRKEQRFQVEKFARQTCELFLKWMADQKMRAIAEHTGISNAEKIAQLRQQYFADIDALEKSGEVQLPA